jgi:hypothetical protein
VHKYFPMNVLILTPDRVGSTLLQRLITVYANLNENQQPLTINLHELTNGLVSYHNDSFNCKILGKQEGGWGYHQNLQNIAGLINDCGHDVVSRLAHYHIKNRKDSATDQLAFYKWVNENFYIIAARRNNLFEHVMSWCIAVESKRLNVYSFEEKHAIYHKLLQNPIDIPEEMIKKYLVQYQEYMDWVDSHFHVNSYFEYERDLLGVEQYILNLSVFKKYKQPLTWKDRWEISWEDWNRMHYLLSLVSFNHHFTDQEHDFMKSNIDLYTTCRIDIQDLQDQGILVSGIPIKLHTLQQKTKLISNVPQCLEHYNNWARSATANFALTYTPAEMTNLAALDHSAWCANTGRALTYNDITQQKLLLSDLKE